MPTVKIYETIVSPDSGGTLVQLQISDAPLADEIWAIRLTLAARVPAFEGPLLVHVQRAAVLEAVSTLKALADDLLQEVPSGYPDRAAVKK